MTAFPDSELWIGVDGGATEVKAHAVVVLSAEAESSAVSLALGSESASCCYDRLPGFKPVPIERQLDDEERGEVHPTDAERAAGELWIEAIAGSILAIASDARRTHARVGVCMPGLKTPDGRGTAVARNGPRIPDLLDRLEERIARGGLELAQPIPPLIGDGVACGLGEDAEAHGLFRGVADAYYIGGGTGIAECFKLEGRVVGFDELRGSLEKAWQIEASPGNSFEDVVSVGGINRAYVERSGEKLPTSESEFPEQRALRGDEIASELVHEAAEALAELIVLRLTALRAITPGALGVRKRTTLERVVLGQRLGRLYAEPSLRRILRDPVDAALARKISGSGDLGLRASCLDGALLRPGFVSASTLRGAPAIGAAAHALACAPRTAAPRRGARRLRG